MGGPTQEQIDDAESALVDGIIQQRVDADGSQQVTFAPVKDRLEVIRRAQRRLRRGPIAGVASFYKGFEPGG